MLSRVEHQPRDSLSETGSSDINFSSFSGSDHSLGPKGGQGQTYYFLGDNRERLIAKVSLASKNQASITREFNIGQFLELPWMRQLTTVEALGEIGDRRLCIIMSNLGDDNVTSYLKTRKVEALSAADIKALYSRVIKNLGHIHSKGVMHGDVKPQNIVIGDLGPTLVDYGVARFIDSAKHEEIIGEKPRNFFGTTGFMAPELFFRTTELGTKADIWSLGVSLYNSITRTKLFPIRKILKKHISSPSRNELNTAYLYGILSLVGCPQNNRLNPISSFENDHLKNVLTDVVDEMKKRSVREDIRTSILKAYNQEELESQPLYRKLAHEQARMISHLVTKMLSLDPSKRPPAYQAYGYLKTANNLDRPEKLYLKTRRGNRLLSATFQKSLSIPSYYIMDPNKSSMFTILGYGKETRRKFTTTVFANPGESVKLRWTGCALEERRFQPIFDKL